MIINKLIYLSGFITRYINFKYFYNFNGIITLFVSKKKIVKIKLNSDTNFSFLLKDPYYNRLIYPKYKYEPEIEFLLQKLKKINFLFMDVGANFGYWSVLISSKKYNKKEVIALEPLKSNYNYLKKNMLDNKNRFKVSNIGIGEKKKYSKIYYSNETSNVGASMYKGSNKKINYQIIKIDTIDNILLNEKRKKYVIKLDVEGNEINAIKGAKKTLNKDCLIIYEDHGSDKFHLNSKYLLKKNFFIYYFDYQEINQIKKIDELNYVKKIKHKGYNFIATKSSYFKKVLMK
jgi:FkbM family methyltransferase